MAHRIGVLGVGLMGERMIGALAGDDRFDVVAAFDPDSVRLRSIAARFDLTALDAEADLLALADLDGVYVASPPNHHVPAALRALAHGLPVYLEKPLAASVSEAERLVSALEKERIPAAMHFPFATLSESPAIARDFSTGALGSIERIEVILHFSQWPRSWHKAGEWLAGSEEGGFLREVFSHFAFLIGRCVGALTVETVARSDAPEPGGSETAITATLRAGPEGVPVTLVGGVGGAAPDFNRLTFFGSSRSLRLEDWSKWTVTEGKEWRRFRADLATKPAPWACHHDALDAFFRREAHPLATVREGAEVVRVVEALRGAPAID